ncbi:hypothetical protein ENUP19_0224G0024 [Entamoeba nuttalli]|uniref:Tetraspanin family protein n=2 Tax=Entamoeba nuttalli TaxID=412467 RepID=K2HIY0_ENTNP|nr:hypothetical protein ENU1_002880 [Entamoeba nuttalli P19]EKE42969.1 hypothetical protein ENU1_002880 [Entamoeba nuttalli P19]|eukprot:XP_008854691.1 hypothetical protein ENU1_002880 [Entamoeba nuttalli P19]
MKVIQFIVLGWGIFTLIAAGLWIGVVFVGPIRKMEQNNTLAKSSLNYYSRNTFVVETCTVAALMGLLGIILCVYSLIPKPTMGIVSYIGLALAVISALATVGYFGYTYFHMRNATNASMSSSLALWEEKFGCCGWDVYRQKPLCASDVGSLNPNMTCKIKTQPLRNASLQNFAVGCFFIVVLFVSAVMIIILQQKTKDTTGGYTPV